MSPAATSVERIGADPVTASTEIAEAIEGDARARWRALEECRESASA